MSETKQPTDQHDCAVFDQTCTMRTERDVHQMWTPKKTEVAGFGQQAQIPETFI